MPSRGHQYARKMVAKHLTWLVTWLDLTDKKSCKRKLMWVVANDFNKINLGNLPEECKSITLWHTSWYSIFFQTVGNLPSDDLRNSPNTRCILFCECNYNALCSTDTASEKNKKTRSFPVSLCGKHAIFFHFICIQMKRHIDIVYQVGNMTH